MKPNIFNLILRSLLFYRKTSVYQAVIVFILAAIITGSLLTGYLSRESLKTSANEHLGNTDLLISSGLRYFDTSLSDKISQASKEKCVSVLETSGYCQNFTTGVTVLNTKIYGITKGFFSFHGNDSILISPGSVAVNQNLAQHLGIDTGDEIIVHFREVTSIPANAPFARSEATGESKVMKVSKILGQDQSGNFNLGISQIAPMNVFISLSDLTTETGTFQKANRLLVENKRNITPSALQIILKQSITASDIGLFMRQTGKNGGVEIISDRIFINHRK